MGLLFSFSVFRCLPFQHNPLLERLLHSSVHILGPSQEFLWLQLVFFRDQHWAPFICVSVIQASYCVADSECIVELFLKFRYCDVSSFVQQFRFFFISTLTVRISFIASWRKPLAFWQGLYWICKLLWRAVDVLTINSFNTWTWEKFQCFYVFHYFC